MKQRFLPLAAFCSALLAAVFTLSSCREDTIIKSSLTPAVDNIHTFGIGPDFNNGTDTFVKMVTGTVYQDTVNTSTRNTGFPIYHALGSIRDPFASITNVSIYAQFVPTTTSTTLSGAIDSVVLVLPYAGLTWGDTTQDQTHTFKAYAITESFTKDSTYYNFNSKATGALLGTGTVVTGHSISNKGHIQDSVALGKNKLNYSPHMRIKLDTNWAHNSFLPALAYDTSYTAFTQQFRGICIMEDSAIQQRSLPYFRLNGSADLYNSAAILFYMNGSDTAIQFPYNETYAAHFNRITRNYSGFPIASLLSTSNLPMVAMQNAPGASIDFILPELKKLIASLPANAIINKAELTLTQVASGQPDDDKFFPPVRLYPQGVNASGGIYTIADRYPITDATLNFMDGTSASITRNGTAVTVYRINFPRELQQAIVAGMSSLHLRVGGTTNYAAAFRVVLGGMGSTGIYRPTLNIIYSKQ